MLNGPAEFGPNVSKMSDYFKLKYQIFSSFDGQILF